MYRGGCYKTNASPGKVHSGMGVPVTVQEDGLTRRFVSLSAVNPNDADAPGASGPPEKVTELPEPPRRAFQAPVTSTPAVAGKVTLTVQSAVVVPSLVTRTPPMKPRSQLAPVEYWASRTARAGAGAGDDGVTGVRDGAADEGAAGDGVAEAEREGVADGEAEGDRDASLAAAARETDVDGGTAAREAPTAAAGTTDDVVFGTTIVGVCSLVGPTLRTATQATMVTSSVAAATIRV